MNPKVRPYLLLIPAILLSGTMFALALPPVSISAFGWFALAPLFLAARTKGFLTGFISGILTGLTAAAASLSPLYGPHIVPDSFANWNIVGFGLYSVVIALITGLFAEAKTPTFRTALTIAFASVLIELITFIKLPAHLALTQFANAPALTLASITGIWGVSFLLWLSNLTLASISDNPKLKPAIPAVAVIAIASNTIWWNLPTPSTSPITSQPTSNKTRLALLQTPEFGANQLLPIQEPLKPYSPKLAVWPELSTIQLDLPTLQEFASSPDGWPIITTYHDSNQPLPHNTAQAITKNGPSAPYYKRKPFGEESSQITAGTKPITVMVHDQNVGLNICFDSCFPWVMRETALNQNPDLIALPTLDPPSPNGFIQAAHAAFTPFRAAELGTPIIRAESTAWSMFVDQNGKIHRLAPIAHQGPLAHALTTGSKPTIYKKLGDWFLPFSLISILALTLTNPQRGKKQKCSSPSSST